MSSKYKTPRITDKIPKGTKKHAHYVKRWGQVVTEIGFIIDVGKKEGHYKDTFLVKYHIENRSANDG